MHSPVPLLLSSEKTANLFPFHDDESSAATTEQILSPLPPQSQAYASNLPECNAINFGAVEAVLTPTATMLVDGLNLDVDGVIERLLETPRIRENHRTQLRRPLY